MSQAINLPINHNSLALIVILKYIKTFKRQIIQKAPE